MLLGVVRCNSGQLDVTRDNSLYAELTALLVFQLCILCVLLLTLFFEVEVGIPGLQTHVLPDFVSPKLVSLIAGEGAWL